MSLHVREAVASLQHLKLKKRPCIVVEVRHGIYGKLDELLMHVDLIALMVLWTSSDLWCLQKSVDLRF